jgi:hypothetical protein
VRLTHIRRDATPEETVCGHFSKDVTSISQFHYEQRHDKPEIAGQLQRLPEPLCSACEGGFLPVF